MELDLAAEVVVEHADLLKNFIDGLRCVVLLGDLEQRFSLLLLQVLSLKPFLLEHIKGNLTKRDGVKFS